MDYPQYIVEEEVFQEDIEKGNLKISFINSTVAFLIAYLLVYLIFQLVTVITASYFQIETDWYYYKVGFLAVTMSPLWHFLSIKSIFSAGPIVSLVMAFVYFSIYISSFKDKQGLTKLILLWATLLSFNQFFGQFIGGDVAYQFSDKFLGFLYVTNYMFISKDIENWLAIACTIILITLGFFSTRYFLSTSYSRFFLFNNRMKFVFKINTVFLPAVAGTVIIFFIKLPMGNMDEIMEHLSYNIYEVISYLTMLIMLIPVFNNYNSQVDLAIQIVNEERKQRIEWKFLIFAVLFYAAFRIILDPSLNMGLHFNAMKNGFDIDTFLLLKHKL